MTRYTVFFEPTSTGYSAYVPDLPGCVAAASTLEETRQLIREARMGGDPIPEPTSHIEQVEVSA
jgi:predicted RNase H-like HicB family nuclease